VIDSSHIIVSFLPLLYIRGLDASLVVSEKEGQTLEDEMLAIIGLSFEGVVAIRKAYVQVDHCVFGIQCVRSEEVV
jgi:hypothetical protein